MNKKGFLVLMVFALTFLLVGIAAAQPFLGQNRDFVDGLVGGYTYEGNTVPTTIYVNPGGLGDVLIYGYYNARGEVSFLRLVNTSTEYGAAVKIRFREGDDSNEVLDFFICLSNNDQWTGWIAGDTDPSNPGILYWYDDDTPTYPDPQNDNDVTNNMLATVAFKHAATGAASAVSADDTKEGYVEVLGVIAYQPGDAINTPNACGELLGIQPRPGLPNPPDDPNFDVTTDITDTAGVSNALFGAMVIFDPVAFTTYTAYGAYGYNATALAYCVEGIQAADLATEGSPLLQECYDTNGNGTGIDEVNLALTKSRLYALYEVDSDLGAASDFINVFPTRRGSIETLTDNGPFNDAAIVDRDTGELCVDSNQNGSCDSGESKVCEDTKVTLYDDAENSPTTTGFSPGVTPVPRKCYDVNYVVMGVDRDPIMNTALEAFKIDVGSYDIGFVVEDFTGDDNATTIGSWTVYGLPVISYELGSFIGEAGWMLPLRYIVDYAQLG